MGAIIPVVLQETIGTRIRRIAKDAILHSPYSRPPVLMCPGWLPSTAAISIPSD